MSKMRRDEYLKQQKKNNADLIQPRNRVCFYEQLKSAGLNPDEYIDDKGNWYVSVAKDHYTAKKSNKSFSDAQEFWRKHLNWGINSGKRRWFNKSEASGYLFEQYMRYCVKQNKLVEKSVVRFTKSDMTVKNGKVFSGWDEYTIEARKKTFVKALAATILANIKVSNSELLGAEYQATGRTTFDDWLENQFNRPFTFKPKEMPRPYFIFAEKEGTCKHHKLTQVDTVDGIPHYECYGEITDGDKKIIQQNRQNDKYALVIMFVLLLLVLFLIFALF